jgi:hypothetical protein
MSWVILGAYAPGAPASGDAGEASLPLLFNPAVAVGPPPDPPPEDEIPWSDHSPDLLLSFPDHIVDVFAGSALEPAHTQTAFTFPDHVPVNFALTDHTPAGVAFTDHTPD